MKLCSETVSDATLKCINEERWKRKEEDGQTDDQAEQNNGIKRTKKTKPILYLSQLDAPCLILHISVTHASLQGDPFGASFRLNSVTQAYSMIRSPRTRSLLQEIRQALNSLRVNDFSTDFKANSRRPAQMATPVIYINQHAVN